MTIDFISLSDLMVQQRDESCPVAAGCFGNADWQRFQSDVAELVQVLHSGPQKRWALCLQDSYHFSVAFMAVAHAGCDLVLPGNLQPDALQEISSGFDGLIADVERSHSLGVERIQLPLPSGSIGTHFSFHPLDLNNLYLTLYTSGSSGVPKPVKKSLALLDAEIRVLETLWGDVLGDSLIAGTVSHQHIYGLLFRILWPLCAGRSFERRVREHPEQVIDHGGMHVVLISSPALLKRLAGVKEPTAYRAVFSSGGVLPYSATLHCLAHLNVVPIEVFGSTETGGIAFRNSTTAEMPWTLFPPLEMKVNETGCLCIQSPFTGGGGWIDTADRCRPLSPRTFILAGRADRIVKVEEKRISLPELEQHLQRLCWINEAVALPLEQPARQILCAVITLSDEGRQKVEELGRGRFWILLRAELRRKVEPVGIPRRYRIVDQLPINSQGKYSLRKMKMMFTGGEVEPE